MPKAAKPFTTPRRTDSKTFQLTLNPTCGLSHRVCAEWQRKSFYDLPDELATHRNPKTKAAAETGALALISYLKKKQEEGSAMRSVTEDITVGAWTEKFIAIETSPKTGINASKNKPYSLNTLDSYKSYYKCHTNGNPICKLKMAEVEEEDVLEYITRLSIKKFKTTKDGEEIEGKEIGGSRTFTGVIVFMRLVFNEYQKKTRKWFNPFQNLPSPKSNKRSWDALPEDEMLKLFQQGVLLDTMELAVCAAIFLSGLRRGEVSALRPEDLDWHTPKILICQSWQRFNKKKQDTWSDKREKNKSGSF